MSGSYFAGKTLILMFAKLMLPRCQDRFVAIEPESGEYFLGDSFDEAVRSATTIKIGSSSTFHVGLMQL